ncbi:hypothetical protein MHYP_G00229480 [Metynnis hypsauchen]
MHWLVNPICAKVVRACSWAYGIGPDPGSRRWIKRTLRLDEDAVPAFLPQRLIPASLRLHVEQHQHARGPCEECDTL